MLFDFATSVPPALMLLAVLSLALLLWRVWSFTVRPLIHSDEPRDIPYWTPVLGHALSFFKDSYGLVSYGRSLYGSEEPFAITLGGQTLYVVTSAKHAADIYNKISIFSWDEFVSELLLKFGVEPSALPKICEDPRPGDARYASPSNPQSKSIVHLSEEFYRKQFLPGPGLDDFSDKLLRLVQKSLSWKRLSSRYTSSSSYFPLMDLCAELLVDSTTRSIFDDLIYEIEPQLTQMVIDFTEEAWKMLLFPYPKFAAQRLYNRREVIYKTLTKYIKSPQESRTGESWVMRKILEEQKMADVGVNNMSSVAFMLFWAANLNAYRLSFWVLSYILCDKDLLDAVKAETKPAFEGDTVNNGYVYNDCPRLSAILEETLRLTFGSVSVRKVTVPTVIGTKVLQPGNPIMIPIRQLHYSESAFGGNAGQFDAERFLKETSLNKSISYKPFAGGVTHCPGRFLAKREVLVFVATILHRFDIEVLNEGSEERGRRPPKIDHISPNLGIMPPVKGTELYIRLKRPTV